MRATVKRTRRKEISRPVALVAAAIAVALGGSVSGAVSPSTVAHAAYDEFRPGTQTPVQEAGETSWSPGDEYTKVAQPFIQHETGQLSTVTLQVWDIPSGYDFASVAIHEFSQQHGPSADPIIGGDGGQVTYEAAPVTTLGTPMAATVAFPNRPMLTAGTHYAIVIEPLSSSGENVSFVTYVHYQGSAFPDLNPWQFDSETNGWEGYSNTFYVPFSSELVTSYAEPTQPALVAASDCGVEAGIMIPESPGVSYSESRVGSLVTVTAHPVAGFEFNTKATTSWEFDVAAAECGQTATPAAPVLVAGKTCRAESSVELPDSKGVSYVETRDGNVVTVTAQPETGFEFPSGAKSSWEFNVAANACPDAVVQQPGDGVEKLAQTGDESSLSLGVLGGILLLVGGAILAVNRRWV